MPHPPPLARSPRLSAAQKATLRVLALNPSIRSMQAGEILHSYRERRCSRPDPESGRLDVKGRYRGRSCCRYASADGNAAMHRLARRGLVERYERGRWRLQREETT